MKRHKTGILVNVLNLSNLEKLAREEYIKRKRKEYNKTVYDVNLKTANTYGVIASEQGLYLINCAGNGQTIPIQDKYYETDPVLQIPFYQVSPEGKYVQGPLMNCPMTTKYLNTCPVVAQVPLEDFIGKYSLSCEQRFREWATALSTSSVNRDNSVNDAVFESYNPVENTSENTSTYETDENFEYDNGEEDKATAEVDYVEQSKWLVPTLSKSSQVEKYGKFLVNRKCQCSPYGEALVNVQKNICHCGQKSPHSHCKKCGCVL